ncbi:16873_t:CDS:1, partial [Acaulospora morrowiae]
SSKMITLYDYPLSGNCYKVVSIESLEIISLMLLILSRFLFFTLNLV